jgi:ABC-type polysaccharide/polyol phosphate export permease
MKAELKELWRYRELLFSMVERELKIRYKNSYFGFLWSLINPLITVLVMTVVFKHFGDNHTQNFSAYILAAYLPFMFFQTAIMDSAQSVLGSLPLIRKIYFPREILPLASIISNFVHLVLALAVFFIYLLYIYLRDPSQVPFQITIVYLPVLLLINLMLATGLGLIISALNTFYEDIKYITGVALYLMLFVCPIMYFSEMVRYSSTITEPSRTNIYYLYHLNPLAMLCTAYRKVLLAPQDVKIGTETYHALPLDWVLLGITGVMSFAILVFGYWLFNRLKWRFVERP